MATNTVFEDSFEVKTVDPDGRKFDRVQRVQCHSHVYDMDLLLDVNTQLFPLALNQAFALALVRTLQEDGAADDGLYDQGGRTSLADKYEYVMHGRVYRMEEDKDPTSNKLSVFVSFGGLLMRLKGDVRNLATVNQDEDLYVLIRKI